IQNKVPHPLKPSIQRTQKQYYLPQQIKPIQNHLPHNEPKTPQLTSLISKIQHSTIPHSLRQTPLKQFNRYEKI
ncbi:hypothetical protein, partial [Bacillus sp. WP8]|uniref:hypothetical protein n=1 Tax=Bacillus sp. WP8 TaxID=756828 RepID=UPI001C92F904